MDPDRPFTRRIADLASDERPRERLQKNGPASLSHAELLAILISTGTKKHSAIDLARLLLDRAQGDLDRLGAFALPDYTAIEGIGPAKAITLMAALELGRRRASATPAEKPRLRSPEALFELVGPRLRDLDHEEMWVVYLTRTYHVIQLSRHSEGGSHQAILDIKRIAREALALRASTLMIAHNHPSGSLNPSQQDIDITKKLNDAMALFDIPVIDHIIIAGHSFTSMRAEELL